LINLAPVWVVRSGNGAALLVFHITHEMPHKKCEVCHRRRGR